MATETSIRICQNCGVELDAGMLQCPLCSAAPPSGDAAQPPAEAPAPTFYYGKDKNPKQKRFVWEMISIILLSGSTAAFVVDLILSNRMTWSEYPAAIALAIFAYVSCFTLWKQKPLLQLAGSFVLASLFIVTIDVLANTFNWALDLGIPILFAANLVGVGMVLAVRHSKYKGLNLLGYGILGAAGLCLCIDGILSFHATQAIQMRWSVIVSSSIVPVALVLFFMHFRLKKGRDLKKTFHL